MKLKSEYIVISILCIGMLVFGFSVLNTNNKTVAVSAETQGLNNQKIEWGIKRAEDHKQPDLGTKNIELMKKYNGLAMGNANDKFLYLTFDNGYEAGYTPKILETLKNNGITATFFITAHYLNSQPELVKNMIDNGNIVRKSHG